MKWQQVKGAEASRLRQRKHRLLRRFPIPASALGGSLSLSYRKCGKATCHCATDMGHPAWSLTFMVDGVKHVERIPADWVDEIRPLVERGQEVKKGVAEVLAINAQILVLWRKETDGKSGGKRSRGRQTGRPKKKTQTRSTS